MKNQGKCRGGKREDICNHGSFRRPLRENRTSYRHTRVKLLKVKVMEKRERKRGVVKTQKNVASSPPMTGQAITLKNVGDKLPTAV